MAAIPMFNLPVLNTQYEKIQPMPTSNWMTALGQGLETVGEAGKNVADAKRIQETNKKRKELEAMLNSAKTDKERLDILNRKLEELEAELSVAENERNATIESAQTSMEGYSPRVSIDADKAQNQMQGYKPEQQYNPKQQYESRMQMIGAFGGMSKYPGQAPEAPEETMTPINTSGFTPMVFPQLRG